MVSPRRVVHKAQSFRIVPKSPRDELTRQLTYGSISASANFISLDQNSTLKLLVTDLVKMINNGTVLPKFINEPFGFDLFKVLLTTGMPYEMLHMYIRRELDQTDKNVIFRDDGPANKSLMEFISTQSHMDQLLESYMTKWGDLPIEMVQNGKKLEPNQDQLIDAVDNVVNDIDRFSSFMNDGIIYLCGYVHKVAKEFGHQDFSAVMSLLFLRIIVPAIVNPKEGFANKNFMKLLHIGKYLQTVASGTVNGTEQTSTNEKIKIIQEKLLKITKKIVRLSSQLLSGMITIDLTPTPLDLDALLSLCYRLGLMIMTNENEMFDDDYRTTITKKIKLVYDMIKDDIKFKNINSKVDPDAMKKMLRELRKSLKN